MQNNKTMVLLLLIAATSFAQQKWIKGKIVADGNNVEGINLVNLSNEKSAITNANGEFLILAQEADLLVFSSEAFFYKRKIIEAEDLKKELLVVTLEPKPIEMEEVVITDYKNLTAYNLGIINYIPKQYSIAERRMISKVGTAKDRKAQLEIEKKINTITAVENLFEEYYFTKTLRINPNYITAFKYYFAEDNDFAKVVKKGIIDDITIAIISLAQKFNSIQKENISKE